MEAEVSTTFELTLFVQTKVKALQIDLHLVASVVFCKVFMPLVMALWYGKSVVSFRL